MLVNADFLCRAVVTPDQYQWVMSPQGGVERVMLDRLGGEKARATSIVRYAPASHFPVHAHPGGEEILVLSGTFSDASADFPAGWYLRNPPGSSHAPFSTEGATIFVKLWQMSANDKRSVRIDTRDPQSWRQQGEHWMCPLFSSDSETVWLQRVLPGQTLFADTRGGVELLVIDGALQSDAGLLQSGSWVRHPALTSSAGAHNPHPVPAAIGVSQEGATVYLKTGHLAHPVASA